MSNSFDIATEGLLQTDGQCLKTVVRTDTVVQTAQSTQNVTVARDNGGTLVAASVAAPVTVTPAPTQTVSAERVDTQVIVAPGCGNSSAPSGVSSYNDLTDVPLEFPPEAHVHSYNDLTDVPTEFPPEAHTHAISTITGLEPRIFAELTAYTFDIDAANADEGLTDPYKFKTVSGAADSIATLAATMPLNTSNTITMLLGDGEHNAAGFVYLFTYGTPGGAFEVYNALPGLLDAANVRLIITSKTAPTAIADNEWTLIASAAVDAATRSAAATANKALLISRFPCRIVTYSGDPLWYGLYLFFPPNCTLDGVAIVAASTIYLRLPQLGVKPVATFKTRYWYVDTPLKPLNPSAFVPGLYNLEGAVLYMVHGSADMHALGPLSDAFTLAMVNPDSTTCFIQSLAYDNTSPAIWGTFKCLGNNSAAAQGWLSIAAVEFINLYVSAASVLKSGEVFMALVRTVGSGGSYVTLSVSGKTGTGALMLNKCAVPVRCANIAAFNAAYPGSIGGFISFNKYAASLKQRKDLFGTGSPNGVTLGDLGDTYTNLSGGANTTLWVKESGVNTNTGWVAK